MNKSQLVDTLADRLGDRRTAAAAVDGLLETIVDTVRSGETVTITGFGVFESRARAARTARNPRTGVAVDVPATTVPAFRPGAGFRAAVGGAAPVTASVVTPTPAAAKTGVEAPANRAKNGDKASKSKDRAKDGGKASKGSKKKKAKSKN
jgi:DNA-binding protein HU-beta